MTTGFLSAPGLPELACPQCGGRVRPEQEDAFVRCEYCGARLFLDPGGAVRHEIVPFLLGKEDLAARLGRWLASREADGTRTMTNVSARRLFVPFWVDESGERTRVVPATPVLGDLSGFHLPAGDRRAFREESVGDATLVAVGAHLAGAGRTLPAGDPRELARRIRLVHLPFWELSFRLWGREHRVWIDGASGQVVPHTTPASIEMSLDQLYASLLAATWAVVAIASWFTFESRTGFVFGSIAIVASAPAAHHLLRRAMARREGR